MNIIAFNQGSDAWKTWRREGLGGSDIAAILGLSPHEDHTRASVFSEKVHGIEREASFAMHRGTRLEPVARAAYESHTRTTAPPVCVEMDGCPWARVSLDGLCSSGAAIDPLRWILELKCPNWETHDAALAGVVALHFEVQVQWQMLVCGLDHADFASFNPGERFTPASFPLLGEWRKRYAKWMELPHPRKEKRPEPIDPWLELHPTRRPPMPGDWLAVQALAPDHEKQAWIMEEAAKFWLEVLEARDALLPKSADEKRADIEAEFA